MDMDERPTRVDLSAPLFGVIRFQSGRADQGGEMVIRPRQNMRFHLSRAAGIRAIIQEIFTALLFAQQPSYFKRIQELQQINLRI